MNFLQAFIDKVRQAYEYAKSRQVELAELANTFNVLQQAISDIMGFFAQAPVSRASQKGAGDVESGLKQCQDLQNEIVRDMENGPEVNVKAVRTSAIAWGPVLFPLIMNLLQQVINKLQEKE